MRGDASNAPRAALLRDWLAMNPDDAYPEEVTKMLRLSAQQLVALRNDVPIAAVLRSLLAVPTREEKGLLRFACPLCGGLHSAIHPSENLARCFDCQRNFNPIDLVMLVRQLPFRDAVALLQRHRHQLQPSAVALSADLPAARSSPAQASHRPASSPPPDAPQAAPAHELALKLRQLRAALTSTPHDGS